MRKPSKKKELPAVEELENLKPGLIGESSLNAQDSKSLGSSFDDERSRPAGVAEDATLDPGEIVEADEEPVVTVKSPRAVMRSLDERAPEDRADLGDIVSQRSKSGFPPGLAPMHPRRRRSSARLDVARAILLVSLLSR